MKSNGNRAKSIRDDGEISVSGLTAALWRQWVVAAGSFLVVTAAAVTAALVIPNRYTASNLIAPIEVEVKSTSGIPAQYADLARMAGVDLGFVSRKTGADRALEVLRSRKFVVVV